MPAPVYRYQNMYTCYSFVGSLYLGFRGWNGHVTLAKAEHCLFVSFFGLAGLQDSGMCAATGNVSQILTWPICFHMTNQLLVIPCLCFTL